MRSIVLLCVLSSIPAYADIAPPTPPPDLRCPGGAAPVSNGLTFVCEPMTCANDATCGEGFRCDEGSCVELEVERHAPSASLAPVPVDQGCACRTSEVPGGALLFLLLLLRRRG